MKEPTLREAAEALLSECSDCPYNGPFHKMRHHYKECEDALRAALARPDDWISVEDRLPPWGERVLVWTGEGVYVASRWNVPGRTWEWEWAKTGDKIAVEKWQPLPEPPKAREVVRES